jgi:transcription antitermination factor NusG
MNETKNWFAIYTRPRWEKKVAEILTKNKIENYCPLNKVVRQWSDRKKTIEEPLFTSYVFVRIPENQQVSVKRLDGVLNLVYWLGKPAVIQDAEIDIIKRFLTENSNVLLEKTPVNINDRVRIVNGPLMELEGEVLSIRNRRIKIVLPSLGYLMYAEVETSNVEVLSPVMSSQGDLRTSLYAYK